MTRDYAEGYWRAMERCIAFGRVLEGDGGFIETEICNDTEFIEAEEVLFNRKSRAALEGE